MELTQEQYDEIIKKLRILSFQQQEANDLFEGGLTSRNLASFRNTYVINAQDSLDITYPMYVHFNILDEMIKIVSVKVDFWILNYRAYSKAGVAAGTPSGGGATSGPTGSASGGGSTSGATGSASGGGSTSGSGGATTPTSAAASGYNLYDLATTWTTHNGGYLATSHGNIQIVHAAHTHTVTIGNHTHSTPAHTHPNHTHTTPNHTHPNHTHSTPNHTHPDHTHDAAYGIFEEETSPTIKFYVSENAGTSYSDVYGGYDINKSAIDITPWLTKSGSKLIRFTSDVRARLSVQIEIKLDIKAR